MVEPLIVAAFSSLIAWASVRANARFRDADRLPMQWGITGEVNWTAPRVAALCFTPVLAVLALSVIAALSLVAEPRPGQEGLEVPVLVAAGAAFLAAHLLHLWLIDRTLRGGRRPRP